MIKAINNIPRFIDFEASGLGPDSYPIQVAWSLPDDTIECWLIRPKNGWVHWEETAEHLHGICREQLFDLGKPAQWVADRMNEQLFGQIVYSDCPVYDSFWNSCLYRRFECRFEFRDIIVLLENTRPEFFERYYGTNNYKARTMSRLEEIKKKARLSVAGPQHQADNDVRCLIRMYKLYAGLHE